MDQPIGIKWNSLDRSVCFRTKDLLVKVTGVRNMVIKMVNDTLMISVLVNGYYKTTEI